MIDESSNGIGSTASDAGRVPIASFGFVGDRVTSRLARFLRLDADRSYVEIGQQDLTARFGPWVVTTPLSNVVAAEVTGPYRWWKAIGPHWSLADGGLTFGTNATAGVCMRFQVPVTGGDPFGRLRHPGLTVTVERPHELAALVNARIARTI